MKVSLTKLPNTDTFYNVHVTLLALQGKIYVGQVKKVYLSRSQTAWTIDPRDFEPRVTTRLCYNTRKEAVDALLEYVKSVGTKRSLVEG